MPIYEVLIAKEKKKKNKFTYDVDTGEGESEERVEQEQILLGPITLTAKNRYSAFIKAISNFTCTIDPDELDIIIRLFEEEPEQTLYRDTCASMCFCATTCMGYFNHGEY